VQNHVTLNLKVIPQGDPYGIRWNEFTDSWKDGTRNDLQDSMLRSRYTPNDNRHKFDDMNSLK